MASGDQYIATVLRHVWAPEDRLERFESDLRAHFEAGSAAGETEAQVIARLGDAADVAAAFMEGAKLDYAGFWERLFAFVGDVGFLLLGATPILLVGCLFALVADGSDDAFPAVLVMVPLAVLAIGLIGFSIFYFPLLESHYGKTLGKHLMKIRVRTEAGGRVGLGAAFLRRLSLYFEILVLDALFVPFTKRKQRAFDIVASTVVVRELDGTGSAVRYLYCLLPWLVIGAIAAITAVLMAAAAS